MSNIIQDLIAEGVLVGYWDFRSGSFKDWSGSGNDGAGTDTVWTGNGIGFPENNSVITVPDHSSLQLTQGALVVFGDFIYQDLSIDRLIRKRDVGGTNFDWYITGSLDTLGFYDGSDQRTISHSILGTKYNAINFSSGGTPEGFSDGLSIGNYNGTVSLSADDSDLYIGNNDVGTAALESNLLKSALIINRQLTATEHSKLYAALQDLENLWTKPPYINSSSNIIDDGDRRYGPTLITDGDMEAAGTAAYTPANNATLTKETGTPHGGSQVLRIAYNGTANARADQIITSMGKRYRATGWARGDGVTLVPSILDGGSTLFTGTTSTNWQYFDVEYTAGSNSFRIMSVGAVAGYTEFDDVSVQQVLSPISSWNMWPVNNQIIDQYGPNDGTIYGAVQEWTPLGTALRFDGASNYIDCGNDTSLDVTTGMTFSCWIKADDLSHAGGGNFPRIIEKLNAYQLYLSNTGLLTFTTNGVSSPSFVVSGFSSAVYYHLVATYNSSTGIKQIYVNGSLEDEETGLTGNINTTTNFLYIGSNGSINRSWKGLIINPQLYSYAQDETWVANEYAKGRTALFKTDWGATESTAAVSSGYLENTPFQVDSGSFKISTDSIIGYSQPTTMELLVDGDMEAAGVAAWTANRSSLTKEIGARTGGGGSKILRVQQDPGFSNTWASQNILTAGITYRARGWARSDGSITPAISAHINNFIWTGTTSTSWQYFDVEFTPAGVTFGLHTRFASIGYVEFDDVSVVPLEEDVKAIECVTAGVCYVPTSYFQQTPTDAAYGECVWWMYQNATGVTQPRFHFVDVNGDTLTGYHYRFNSDQSVSIVESNVAIRMSTAASYMSAGTWYKCKVIRDSQGDFYSYLNDSLLSVTGGSGTNPFNDISQTVSNYISLELDAGDKIAYSDIEGNHSLIKKVLS